MCLINSIGGILSQCKCMSNQHVVHFKSLPILFVYYTSIKLKKKIRSKGKYLCERELNFSFIVGTHGFLDNYNDFFK